MTSVADVAVRYLNTQYIQKQKVNEADISYGGFNVELNEQMFEIGEVRIDLCLCFFYKTLYDLMIFVSCNVITKY